MVKITNIKKFIETANKNKVTQTYLDHCKDISVNLFKREKR